MTVTALVLAGDVLWFVDTYSWYIGAGFLVANLALVWWMWGE